MKNGMRILRWGVLLWKRLYRKLTFVLLLVLIPLLVLGYGMVSREESGVITIALASRPAQTEPITREVMDELMKSNLILFVECADAEAAERMVRVGEADAAWIFEADLESKIYEFVARRTRKNAVVTVLEPERSIPLLLVRELLSGTLFSHCSEALYLTYIRENVPELNELSDEVLLEHYRSIAPEDGLFVFTDVSGNVTHQPEQQTYLLAPVRGMLAVVVVLAGLATAMYYLRDRQNGTFSWLSERWQPLVELGCQLICAVNVTAVALLSLALTKQTAALSREVPVAVLFGLCTSSFAMVVRRLTGGLRGLAMVIPLLVIVMLVVCPVFFDLGALRSLQYLFPPTYFVNGAYSDKYLLSMIPYTAACLAVCWLMDALKRK